MNNCSIIYQIRDFYFIINLLSTTNMIQYIIAAILAIAVGLYCHYVIIPRRNMIHYKKQFQKLGYKVQIIQHKIFGYTSFEVFLNSIDLYGNSMKLYMKDYQDKDLLICNAVNNVEIVLLSPQLIQQFCNKERQLCYRKERMAMNYLQRIIGKGMVSSQGANFKRRRKTMNSIFNFNFISNMTAIMRRESERSEQTQIQKCGNEEFFECSVMDYTLQLASRIIYSGLHYGKDLGKQKVLGKNPAKILIQLVYHAFEQFVDPISLIFGVNFWDLSIRNRDKQYNTKMNTFNQWAFGHIRQVLQGQKQAMDTMKEKYVPVDVISSMASWHIRNPNQLPYNEQDILNQLRTLFVVGVDTTSHLLQALIYYIFRHPQAEKKVRQQIADRIGNRKDYTYEDIKDMPYLEACETQAVRLIGPGNFIFSRMTIKDHDFKGAKISKGVVMSHSAVAVHYSTKYYTEPEKFRPERWINGQCDNQHHFSSCGFHGGPRSCLGKQMALLMMKVNIISLAQNFRKIEVQAEDLKVEIGLIIQAQDFKIKVTK